MKRLKTDKYLKFAYFIGGIYDFVLGVGLIFFAEPFAALFGVTMPDPFIFVQISGLFLIVVGYFLIYSCREPRKYVFVGVGTVFVRFSYVVIVLLALILDTIEPAFVLLALTDGITGLFILLTLLLTEHVTWRQAWQ